VKFITEHFIPVRLHVKEQAADFKRYGDRYSAHWTPTILELDSGGVEQHRIEGFLATDDFLAQLELGLAHAAFKHEDWKEAERRFREVFRRDPRSDVAPEAEYWAGVSRYKASHDAGDLTATWQELTRDHPDSTWAKKASIWSA
jgi:TolA-binding protein